MKARQAGFRVFLMLAMSAGMPPLGQIVAVAKGRTPGTTPVPDFSGIWAHPSLPGFEQPLSGPGPVRNLRRNRNGVGDFRTLVGDYKNPILKPQAAAVVKKFGEMSISGVVYPTPTNQCWPGGVPYIFSNVEMQMLQQAHEVTILYGWDHDVRHVRMNQAHLFPMKASLYGDSVGHYEGDTLVVDTVGINVGPFAMVDMYGTPHSPALHVVERYRLLDYEATKEAAERGEKDNIRLPDYFNDAGVAVDPNYKGKGLQLQFTVEDEGVFTVPWSATITYRRAANEWYEQVCAENMRRTGAFGDTGTIVPEADKPDF